MAFTLRNLRADLADVGSNFDGVPDLEFRLASKALELEQSGLSYQRIPPDYRVPYGPVHGEGTRPGRRASRSSSSARPTSARTRGKTWRASETGGLTERRSVYICLVLGASELARLSIERWNAGDLDGVYATWDPQVIVRPDPYY